MPKIFRNALLMALLAMGSISCTKSTPTMRELLQKKAKEEFFVPENVYTSSMRAAYFDSISKTVPENRRDIYTLKMADALLYGGKTREAVKILEDLLEKSKKGTLRYTLEAKEEEKIAPLLAIAYIRMGEQENCLHHHQPAASCIVPIGPEGYHHVKEGSQKAIVLLEGLLQQNSHDHISRWLLNIAHMTLGQYPQGVQDEWLIPETAFASEYPLKKFVDIAPKLGLDVNALSGGSIVDDFNNDNLLDVMVSSWFPSDPLRYFVNNGDGSFTERSDTAGTLEIAGGLNMVQADYDNDGFLDLFILRGAWMGSLGRQPNSLLRNNGDNTFTDVTMEAGLLSFHPTQTAVWADFNNDGQVDLFIGNESEKDQVHPCELFLNNGDGTFTDHSGKAGLTISDARNFYYVKGVTTGDYNNDGLMDLYVSTLYSNRKNLLFLNQGVDKNGIPMFHETGETLGLGEKFSSFPTWSFDYDNDGWMDIFVAGYERGGPVSITTNIVSEYLKELHSAETMRLYKNKGGTFTDVSKEVGLNKIGYAMGANYGDLDNDGYPDIYLSTGEVSFQSIIPNRVFRNSGGKAFQDVTTAGGFGHIQKGHAVSFSDIDNDGDQDIYVVMGGAYEGDTFFNSLYKNPYQNDHKWATFILEGTKANKAAIGSRLEVTILEAGQERRIFHTIGSGGSFGCSALRAEIGLGTAAKILRLKVTWAGSGTEQLFGPLDLNTFYKIRESDPQPREVHLRPLDL
ncbi:MAG: CRTAC1 family protein [Sediminicola sp.]